MRTVRLLLACLSGLFCISAQASNETVTNQVNLECLATRVVELARDPHLIADLNNYNASPLDPKKLDKVWANLQRHSGVIDRLINNQSAQVMRAWIQGVSIQGEGLLIGRNGGLTSATEKTSDFWQGDEAQFTKAIGLANGQAYVQTEMMDESTHLMLIKVSVPVYNPRGHNAVGVLVIGFDQFVVDFADPCGTTKLTQSAPASK